MANNSNNSCNPADIDRFQSHTRKKVLPFNSFIIILLNFSHVLQPNTTIPFRRFGKAHLKNQHIMSNKKLRHTIQVINARSVYILIDR